MNCDICPVRYECMSARGVAARSCGNMEKAVLDKINMVCPLEEIMYTTFQLIILNVKRELDAKE